MLPSNDVARRSDLGTPRKRATGSHAGRSSSGGTDAFRSSKPAPRRSSATGAAAAARRRRVLIAGAVGAVAALAVLIGVVSWAVPNARGGGGHSAASIASISLESGASPAALLDSAYCSRLPATTRQYCEDYYSAPGSTRFSAASQWQKMAGITCESCRFDRAA